MAVSREENVSNALSEPDWGKVYLDAIAAQKGYKMAPTPEPNWPALWQLRHKAAKLNAHHSTRAAVFEPEPGKFRITFDLWFSHDPMSFEEATGFLEGCRWGGMWQKPTETQEDIS
ncbi:hypothetical protein [Nocardia wallacei]|uniref:hypothetical protein n=1 Tax=Nocardia wallacei TaxID=480035 RepID=UPI0024583549|nr:hypothetical protein [Nocardia wallacei]